MSKVCESGAPKLLIVDDDCRLLEMLCWDLVELGYEVKAACDCRATRALLKKHRFDLALLDYQLPDGNGIDLIALLLGTQPKLPIVMSSAIGCPSIADKALQSGALEFVAKPASIEILHRALQHALHRAGKS